MQDYTQVYKLKTHTSTMYHKLLPYSLSTISKLEFMLENGKANENFQNYLYDFFKVFSSGDSSLLDYQINP